MGRQGSSVAGGSVPVLGNEIFMQAFFKRISRSDIT
jgi:hypothetical protein